MTRRFRLLCLAVLLLTCGFAWAGTGWVRPPADAPFVDRLYDARFAAAASVAGAALRRARAELGLPALSAAVSIDGRLVWAGAVGWADLGARVPIALDTRYRIGSSSKPLTATALARLVQAGGVDPDAPISTWLPDLPNPAWAAITPRQLASHTAGIVGYEENRDWWGLYHSVREGRQFDSVSAGLELFDDTDLMFAPGTGFHYSSFATVLLSAVLEAAAGVPFLDLMEREVFGPAGAAGASADHVDRPVPGRAVFHDETGGAFRPWRPVNHSYKWAGGGFVASSSDLALIGGLWFRPEVLAPGTVEHFWTPQRLPDGRVNEQSYALGWRVNAQTRLFGPDRPVMNAHHGGVSKGALSWLNLYPEFRLAVAVNTNARPGDIGPFFRWADYAITRAFVAERERAGAQ